MQQSLKVPRVTRGRGGLGSDREGQEGLVHVAMPAGTRTLQTRKDSDTEAWARRVGAAVGRASVWGHTGRARPAWPWRGLRDMRSAQAERLGVVFNAGFVVTLRL